MGMKNQHDVSGVSLSGPQSQPNRRLRHYLTSGSFQPRARHTVSDPVRRNRLIFLLVVLMIVGFVIFWMLAE